jgi:hypothetical protein
LRTSPSSIIKKISFASPGVRWLIILWLLLLAVGTLWFWKRPISGVGGLPIPGELVVEVPQFFQSDPKWREDFLGGTSGTLGAEGCAVTSASMVLGFYGMAVDPQRLNQFLNQHGGYEGKAWLRWESAAEFLPGIVQKGYEDLPSYGLIDWNLLHGNPVIVRIRRVDGITHFVVIVGKRGFDYLIRDPAGWSRAEGGSVYPFARLGVPMEALRYYRRLE